MTTPALLLQNIAGVGEAAHVWVKSAGTTKGAAAVNKWGGIWEVSNLPGSGPYSLVVLLADGQLVSLSIFRRIFELPDPFITMHSNNIIRPTY